MNIKNILLGSTAILVATTTTYAADAVMIEPEPIEYVRVCDSYGSGFFYIPGTENCMKISGYARVEYRDTNVDVTLKSYGETVSAEAEEHALKYRARLNFDVRNETDYGTLRSQIRLQGDGGGTYANGTVSYEGLEILTGEATSESISDGNIGIDRLLIELAGVRLGYSDDYWTTIGGYGYYDAALDGQYGYNQAMFIDYSYGAAGFTATVGAVADNDVRGTTGQPDFYAGAKYAASFGNVFGTYHYDSSEEEGAFKVGAELSFADYIPGGSIKAWYMADDGETSYVGGNVWGVSAKANLLDNVTLFAGYSAYECEIEICDVLVTSDSSLTDWTAGVRWTVADGLYVQAEYARTELDVSVKQDPESLEATVDTINVRVVRSF